MHKFADCSHCGKRIVWNVKTESWEHCTPTTGLKPIACYVMRFAAPRRGSVEKKPFGATSH